MSLVKQLTSGTPSPLRDPFAPRRLMGGITRGGIPREDDMRLAAGGDVNRLAWPENEPARECTLPGGLLAPLRGS
jgi:hypothetical protein